MALALCAELDVTGYEKYVPPLDEIDYINFSEGSTGHENQPETLELLPRVSPEAHRLEEPAGPDRRRLLHRAAQLLPQGRQARLPPVPAAIQRRYRERPGFRDRRARQAAKLPELIAQRVGSSIPVTEESISTAYLTVENIAPDGTYLNDTVRLTPAQAYELYTECIVPDAEEGTIGLRFASNTEETRLRTTNVWIYMEMSKFVGRSANGYNDYVYDYIGLDLLTDSVRTYKWITENTSIEPTDGTSA